MLLLCEWGAITEQTVLEHCIQQIAERTFPGGGFAENPKGRDRPDSTAWAVVALARHNPATSLVRSGRAVLASMQLKDGRISFPDSPDVFWPTALAILAWHQSNDFAKFKESALDFLIKTSGNHFPFDPKSPAAHDTSIKGWPWIGGTHSFIDPTAMPLLAMEISGLNNHPRFLEGVRMLLDRQLPHGGWNYGNTFVYGKELLPFVDTTGIALTALAGHAAKRQVDGSIRWLRAQAEECRTPLSLAWALFGLGAWREFPDEGLSWIADTIDKQNKYGPYGTSLLSLLTLAYMSKGDFRKCFA